MASFSPQKKINSRSLAKRGIISLKFLEPTPARLEDTFDSPQGPRERRSTADLPHARTLQPQELELTATVTNILDNEGEPRGFAEASKSEGWMDSMR